MVAGQIIELFKIVRQKSTYALLSEARKSYDRPARMREIVVALGDPNFALHYNGTTGSVSASKKGEILYISNVW